MGLWGTLAPAEATRSAPRPAEATRSPPNPVKLLSDEENEAKGFPVLFPEVHNNFHSSRPNNLTLSHYFNVKILHADGRKMQPFKTQSSNCSANIRWPLAHLFERCADVSSAANRENYRQVLLCWIPVERVPARTLLILDWRCTTNWSWLRWKSSWICWQILFVKYLLKMRNYWTL